MTTVRQMCRAEKPVVLNLGGTVFATQGTVQPAGIGGTYHCGVVAARIAVVEANNSFLVSQDCRIER